LIGVNGLGTAYDVLPVNRHINTKRRAGKVDRTDQFHVAIETITSDQSWNSVPHEAKA
jgi:hypothetical protein